MIEAWFIVRHILEIGGWSLVVMGAIAVLWVAVIESHGSPPCQYCHGSGVVPDDHDYSTEWLGCVDCEGTGKRPW